MKTGIYLIPSILTASNMALGTYSILASIQQDWARAGWSIIAAIFLDIFDGRIARWTHSTSKFGIEFDSLSDWISFGIAPAIMSYLLVLKDFGRIGFAITLLYIICGALRLARFNLKSLFDKEITPYFIGLPIPAAGGILASFVILYDIGMQGKKARTIELVMKQIPVFYHLLPGILFILAILMVSEVKYSSFKKSSLVKPKTLRMFLIMVLGCLMIYIYPQNTIFVLFVGYICSGVLEYLWRFKTLGAKKELHVKMPGGESWDVSRRSP